MTGISFCVTSFFYNSIEQFTTRHPDGYNDFFFNSQQVNDIINWIQGRNHSQKKREITQFQHLFKWGAKPPTFFKAFFPNNNLV